jgi:ubiquinol-cytochrome c reductase iron-sulfur subunit
MSEAAARWVALLLGLSVGAGVGLLVLYALGGQVQLEGALLMVLLGGIGLGLVLWGKFLFPSERATEEREVHLGSPEDLRAVEAALRRGERVERRLFLVRLLYAAAGALGLALVFPVRSLGPGPGRALFRTAWTAGARLVDETGAPVRVDSLRVGGVATVFPEGHVGSGDAQAILVRVEEAALRLPPDRRAWAPEGNVCYSKLCTHAGCPVGLYVSDTHQLQCPCHQSAFLVTEGARPVFGPAPRPLPQLPLVVDGEGFLRAGGDFTEPVGPGFWNREAGSE